MGPLELAVYKSDWKSSLEYLRHVEDTAARRELEAVAQVAQDHIAKAVGLKTERSRRAGVSTCRRATASPRYAIPFPTATKTSRRRNATFARNQKS
jgi:hypothetical protein